MKSNVVKLPILKKRIHGSVELKTGTILCYGIKTRPHRVFLYKKVGKKGKMASCKFCRVLRVIHGLRNRVLDTNPDMVFYVDVEMGFGWEWED